MEWGGVCLQRKTQQVLLGESRGCCYDPQAWATGRGPRVLWACAEYIAQKPSRTSIPKVQGHVAVGGREEDTVPVLEKHTA